MPPNEYNQNPQNTYAGPAQGSAPIPSFDPNQPIPKEKHHLNPLLIPMILAVLFLIATIAFGFWAFMSRQEYKTDYEAKAAKEVAAAERALDTRKEAEFLEREKEPLKSYQGPATFGSVSIKYPKTWSAFITQSDKSNTPIDGYLHPDFVPGMQSGTAFALHFQVINASYDQQVKKFDSQVRTGAVKVKPIKAPKVPTVAGVRVTGEVVNNKQGTTVLFPLRDKTLKLTTESEQFIKDFDKRILANLTFVP